MYQFQGKHFENGMLSKLQMLSNVHLLKVWTASEKFKSA